MVKNQGLSITSGKGNGLCGRLKCCLNYEETFYEEAMADFPDVGELIDTQDGQGEVLAIDIFAKTIKVSLKGAVVPVIYTLEEFQSHG